MASKEIKLDEKEKVILDILKSQNALSSKEIYAQYRETRTDSFRQFFRTLESLCSKGFVSFIGDKRWRKYSFSVLHIDEKDEVDKHLPEWVKVLKEAYFKRSRVT